jgi:hypothetical protein
VAQAAGGTNKILLALAVLMLVVGYTAGSMMSSGGKICGNEASVKAELTKKLTDAGLLPPVMNMSGKVTAVEGKVLTLEVSNLNRNPLLNETPKLRQVTVADDAVIKMLQPLKAEEYQKAQESFNEKRAAFMAAIGKGENAVPPPPPASFAEVTMGLDEIKVGMTANVTAETDVREAASFTAKDIQVSESTAAGAGLPGLAPLPSPQLPTTAMPAPTAPTEPAP